MKIRILDDEERQRIKFVGEIKSARLPTDEFNINVLEWDDFEEALTGMRRRQSDFRANGSWKQDGANPLDDVAVLVVDFELFGTGKVMNADDVVYLARCFTTCGIVVVMNRLAHNPFDLTLKDHPGSFSEVEIGQMQLGSRVLWGTGQEEFAPWYWPVLPKLAEDFRKRIQDVESALWEGKSLREMLELPEESWKWLPRTVLQFLGENDRLENFLTTSPYGLYPKDRVALEKIDFSSVSRILAARISKWLEYLVLPEQDILMDAPHLISRFPSLSKGDRKNVETWNATAVRHTDHVPEIDMSVLEPFRLKKSYWLSRPVWFWRDVMSCEKIDDVREPWNIETPPWVFCEDTSSFRLEEECRVFKAETVSPFASRYVKKLDGVAYSPVQRFAL